MDKIQELEKLIKESKSIVFFGGAGVSTESGIPDFRSQDGLYNQKYDYPPERILSQTFFYYRPDIFYDFYRDKMLYLEAKPSRPHEFLAKLEKMGKLSGIVTQNIDGLHQAAGNKKVFELHGSVLRNYCLKCHKFYSAKDIKESSGIPQCECGGLIKPDVVLYEDGLDEHVIDGAIEAIEHADLLIVGGTSLNVYPAASFIDYFPGKNLVLINKTPTPQDNKASLVIHDSLGDVFEKINLD